VNIGHALAQHRASGAIASMVLRPLPIDSSFAAVEHDESGRIRRIRGLPSASVAPIGLTRAMFTGVQILSSRAFNDLPLDGDMIEGAYLRWLASGEHVQAIFDDSPWVDVGVTVAHYLQANLALARSEIRWPGIEPDPKGNIIDPSVKLPYGVQLDHVVLGRDVHVPECAELSRVVAWPGAHLPMRLSNAVVTSDSVIAR